MYSQVGSRGLPCASVTDPLSSSIGTNVRMKSAFSPVSTVSVQLSEVRGVAVEGLKLHASQDGGVVVAGDASQFAQPAQPSDHLVWIRAVAHQVAQAPGFIHRARVLENGLQRCVVGVDV